MNSSSSSSLDSELETLSNNLITAVEQLTELTGIIEKHKRRLLTLLRRVNLLRLKEKKN